MCSHHGEVPWHSGQTDARLRCGRLFFLAPNGCDLGTVSIRVTEGRDYSTPHEHVWHMFRSPRGTVWINPSIHFIGHFHSTNPVEFALVK